MRYIFLICLCLLGLGLAYWGLRPTVVAPVNPRLQVLVSVAPYKYFVERLGGDLVDIQSLIPEQASPHIYEPSPKETENLSRVALWIQLGEPCDQRVDKSLRQNNPSLLIVNVTEGVDLIHSCEGCDPREGGDLHIWLSPQLAKIQAKTICHGLIQVDPEHRSHYEAQLALLLEDLSLLDKEFSLLFTQKPGNMIAVSHPAFAYFCREYGLEQLSVEQHGKEPSPKQMGALMDNLKKKRVRTLFLQPQYSNKGALLLAEKLGMQTENVDPYSADYLRNLQKMAHKFYESLP